MKIISKNGNEYIVKFKHVGFTFADAYVYKKTKWLWFTYNKCVWEHNSAISYDDAKKMHPEHLKHWFTVAVEQYEKYIEAWKGYNQNE